MYSFLLDLKRKASKITGSSFRNNFVLGRKKDTRPRCPSLGRASLFFSEFGGFEQQTNNAKLIKRSNDNDQYQHMTAVTTTTATPYNGNSSSDDAEKSRSSESFVPSASEEEAKTRFTTSVAAGVDFLMCRGVGREQASRELLNIVANGCSPDEEEVSNHEIMICCVCHCEVVDGVFLQPIHTNSFHDPQRDVICMEP